MFGLAALKCRYMSVKCIKIKDYPRYDLPRLATGDCQQHLTNGVINVFIKPSGQH